MTAAFRRVAVASALTTAAVGLVYTVSFALFVHDSYHWARWASAIALMASGVVVTPALVGLHARFRDREPEFAAVALIAAIIGAFGATAHGGFDVAVLAHPVTAGASLPSEIDPRGFLTFAVTGLALGLFGWLALRTGGLSRSCAYTGLASSLILIVVYLGRLIELDPNANLVRVAALAAGLVLVPGFYLQAGRDFMAPEVAPG